MTNKIAIILGLIIVSAVIVDMVVWQGEELLFLFRKADEFVEWLAFWR